MRQMIFILLKQQYHTVPVLYLHIEAHIIVGQKYNLGADESTHFWLPCTNPTGSTGFGTELWNVAYNATDFTIITGQTSYGYGGAWFGFKKQYTATYILILTEPQTFPEHYLYGARVYLTESESKHIAWYII